MNTSTALEAWKVFKNTFPAPDKYLYTHFSAGEVLIHTYLAPKRPEKPEKPKYLYTPIFYYLCRAMILRFSKFERIPYHSVSAVISIN